jgi:hypothetical protein
MPYKSPYKIERAPARRGSVLKFAEALMIPARSVVVVKRDTRTVSDRLMCTALGSISNALLRTAVHDDPRTANHLIRA